MPVLGTVIACAVVGFIWGSTNVLIKRSTTEINQIQSNSWLSKIWSELNFLIINWKCLLPFALNQSGSILFYFTLLYSELSLAVPVTNSFTFLFTALTSVAYGESVPSPRSIIGSALVAVGIALCVVDKLSQSSP